MRCHFDNYFVSFPEDVSSLGMSQQNPFETDVLNHSRADLTRECSLGHFVAVLGRNAYFLGQSFPHFDQVRAGHGNYHLCGRQSQWLVSKVSRASLTDVIIEGAIH